MDGGLEIGLLLLLGIATITDLLWGKIYNATTLPFLIVGLVCKFLSGVKPGEDALLAVGVAFAIFFPLYVLKAMAAGDVKLLMAVGAWSGTGMVVRIAVAAVLCGALVGLIVMLRKAGVRGSAQSLARHMKATAASSHRMPFAPAFLCAFFLLKIAENYRWFGIA